MAIYEKMLEQIYRCLLRPGDTAIDIGAHTGLHTLPMLDAVGETGKIYAFEPLQAEYQKLKAEILNHPAFQAQSKSFCAYNCALGDKEETTQFVYVQNFPEYSGFRERIYHDNSIEREIITVDVRRLDSFVDQFQGLRYIKIDAEGAELMILKGAQDVIKKYHPVISFELGDLSLSNYPYESKDVYDFLSVLGYNIFSVFGILLSREDFIEASKEQFFWDYVAIPNLTTWPLGHYHLRLLMREMDALSAAARSTTLPTATQLEEPVTTPSKLKRLKAKIRNLVRGN
ncbi:FkbM family methyltransferase [Synechococcus elongatus]|uniref:FkbM family methyltransferase n=1 Tax=Synechococcus elongatus PCC 11801 TaxID=2219813 RepID=A0AAN1QLV2_SYNEL|nr:FkbM family methyltransferase [Synechococcus elongatus]